MAKLILLHFGAFVPGIQQSTKPTVVAQADEVDMEEDPTLNSQMTDGCKGIDSL